MQEEEGGKQPVVERARLEIYRPELLTAIVKNKSTARIGAQLHLHTRDVWIDIQKLEDFRVKRSIFWIFPAWNLSLPRCHLD